MSVRTTVFIDEQHCSPEGEFDADDARSWHWVVYDEVDGGKVPVGVTRLVPPRSHGIHTSEANGHAEGEEQFPSAPAREENKPYVKITRVAVLPAYRNRGLGKYLVDNALEWASSHPEQVSAQQQQQREEEEEGHEEWSGLVLVHAQVQAEKAYEKMGFVTDESMGSWWEEGIRHVGMWKTVEVEKHTHKDKDKERENGL
ncbi:hypothetical protein AJ80_03220 [Polytolypa hystricis UAMH7299]|uniref:N-acetyltransferase domain-containing protein n=1 Tax=Polytolypa hystricis (strain UAMH7299) TaxID=1447883 RepID=A0A2B7YK45_POLH7|nr:hypothetical protein AJ80_03220 [Polytolypa hystricis UAMH7299]